MHDDAELRRLALAIAECLPLRGQWLATAESCTGGWIAKCLTDIAGSSGWFERGLVSYSNAAKQSLLGVPAETLARYGAVSAETAAAMCGGLLAVAPVDWTVAVTGIAGPGGGSPDKPVGTVWLAWQARGAGADAVRFQFPGDREAVRRASVAAALSGLLSRLGGDA